MFDMHQPTFTVTETAKILGVDRSTIYRMIRDNKLDTGLSKPIRIKQKALQIYALDKAPLAHLLWRDANSSIKANQAVRFSWASAAIREKEINFKVK